MNGEAPLLHGRLAPPSKPSSRAANGGALGPRGLGISTGGRGEPRFFLSSRGAGNGLYLQPRYGPRPSPVHYIPSLDRFCVPLRSIRFACGPTKESIFFFFCTRLKSLSSEVKHRLPVFISLWLMRQCLVLAIRELLVLSVETVMG
jgi:hypothetical protein